jgi:hypothetical protein
LDFESKIESAILSSDIRPVWCNGNTGDSESLNPSSILGAGNNMTHPHWRTPEGKRVIREAEAELRIEHAIDDWHGGEADEPLHEYLGWTEDEYKKYLEDDVIPEREYE